MIRITQQDNEMFTVECYWFNEKRHSNEKAYSISNIHEQDLARVLQSRLPGTGDDGNTAFVVVKSGDRPAILTSTVEGPKDVNNGNQLSVFQIKKLGRVSH